MLRKFLLGFVSVFFLLSLTSSVLSPKVYADSNFDISTDAKYNVGQNGDTQVTQTIILVNKTKYTYTPSYSIGTGLADIKNLTANNSDEYLKTKILSSKNGDKKIEVDFDKRIMGLGKKNIFTIHYDTSSIARKGKEGWEITIPGLASPETFTYYTIALTLADSFGKPTAVFPIKSELSNNTYTFDKHDIGNSGIYLSYLTSVRVSPTPAIKQSILISSSTGSHTMPIQFLVILGVIICLGSLIVAKVIYSTWLQYFQKPKV